MKIFGIVIVLFACMFTSCGKKTEVKGVVYSYRGVPVPNANIAYEEYRSSYAETYWNVAKTDANGEYRFSLKAGKYTYRVKCYSDSGYQNQPFSTGQMNTVDLHLQ